MWEVNLATDIQRLRKAVHCSRNQLADKAQFCRVRLWRIESGRLTATANEEIVLRRALHELLKERAVAFYHLLQEKQR